MRRDMEMKNYMRILIVMTALMFGAVSEVCGQTLSAGDIEIDIKPAGAGTITQSVEGRTVTLTITPSANYYIKASDIQVEKLVDPSKANVPTRRIPNLADLIQGTLWNSSQTAEINLVGSETEAKYVFSVPDGYDGAYVTATFRAMQGGVVNITSSTTLSSPDPTAHYILLDDVSASAVSALFAAGDFTGIFEGEAKADGTFPKITGLTQPLFQTVDGGTVKNIVLEDVNISSGDADGNTGAIACTATGDARIYNIGILSGSVGVSGGNVGSIVGLLDGTARVINCYSYANITAGGGGSGNSAKYVGGVVGNNSQTSTQDDIKTIVVNCMFYGEIDTDNCSNYAPVYGNKAIENNKTKKVNNVDTGIGINPYCYFRGTAAFQSGLADINAYKRSWPADEEYLTRFEYYRNILNSNRKLCTWWVNGTNNTLPTDADIENVGIAKWVLDPAIAPYPILKKWGKYPSIINPDRTQTIDPRTIDDNGNTRTPTWTSRSSTNDYKGGILGTLSVTINPGGHAASGVSNKTITLPITDMDTLNYDYGYYKVQLPYYNEIFGNPNSTNHDTRYGGNYKDYVVTGWKITGITGGTPGTFTANWESGYNFADRNCTNKDLYSVSGRVFAQGGFFYVPEGVSAITIEAYWGKAVYLHNSGHYLDRVNITASSGNRTVGSPFAPAGTLATTFQGQTVWDAWHTAVTKLDAATESGSGDNKKLSLSVYDQAIVLLSNFQLRNENGAIGYDIDNKWHPYTIMSIDQDLDNEPDYCFEFQYRKEWGRKGIQPIRFDFLPVPELGMAVRHNVNQNTIGIFVPQGHFEITETSFMHTTQFEYDAATGNGTGGCGTKIPAPIILNGGHFEQIVARYGPQNTTQYFLMGGHFRMLRFTPGAHTSTQQSAKIRLCAVNAIGGEYPEFYLSGIYRPDITPANNQGNPHCYTNGGKFNLIAGAGYDKINGNITFKIDHSIIGEFYGGGINGSKPVGGNIDVTIDHSLVTKYCGGPKVGVMNSGKTVTTNATGTIFTRFYGGGNGGTSYYRWQRQDGNVALPASTADGWANYGYKSFNPLNSQLSNNKQYEGPEDDPQTPDNRGYNALFEFECFVESNGLGQNPTVRSYMHWAQFGTTSTGDITNNLNDCTIKENFYGGGNLGNVSGSVNSTLTDCTVYGSVFGGGFSGKIEPFRVHDRTKTEFPYIDKAGIMHNGALYYVQNTDGTDRYYTWSNASGHNTNNPTFQGDDGKWYVYTTVSLEGLGAVSQNTSLIITTTENGTSTIGTEGDTTTGNVFGGGNESAVDGNTTVTLSGNVNVLGNVFGGGNKAVVGGSTDVKIE